jgi:hypothetical protein
MDLILSRRLRRITIAAATVSALAACGSSGDGDGDAKGSAMAGDHSSAAVTIPADFPSGVPLPDDEHLVLVHAMNHMVLWMVDYRVEAGGEAACDTYLASLPTAGFEAGNYNPVVEGSDLDGQFSDGTYLISVGCDEDEIALSIRAVN